MKVVYVKEVELIAHELARKYLAFNEPIPNFDTRFPNVLESCLAVPFQQFGRHVAYRGLNAKAAILFYLLIKNHPFQNGNKRLAVTILLVFVYKNHKWLTADNRDFYNFAVWVASSPAELKTIVVSAIEQYIKSHLTVIK